MKLAPTLALALLAACSAPRTAGPSASTDPAAPADRPAAPDAELAAISRGMTQVDDAERRGEIAAERARWTTAALQDPADRKARFLSIYAMPHGDDTWAEFKYLTKDLPGSALGWVGMARLYVEWRVLDQLPRTLEAARLAEPGNWLVDLVQAQGDERAERWDAAAAGYRAVLRVDPGNVDAHVGLARLARRAGDAAVARAEAEAALSALPDHVPALVVVAELAAEAGDAGGAAAAWFRVVAASPKDRAARVSLAKLLKAQGDVAGARDQWKAAVALKEDPDGLVALAEASRASGDKQAEQQALERLSQIDPSGAEWRRIAEIRLAAGDQEGAEKALRRAQARDPKDPKVALALGRVVLQLGKPQEALELLRAAGAEGAADREALERRLNVGQPARGEVAAIQRSVGALIDRTYRARLKELPRLSGKLAVRVTVDGAGGASLVEVLEDTVHDDDVTACAYWNLRDAAYPPSKPGRYSFSFTLQAGR